MKQSFLRRGAFLALALSASILPLGAVAHPTPPAANPAMVRVWSAAAPSKVIIKKIGPTYTLQVIAACTPPCNWGARRMTVFGPSISAPVGNVGMATFNQGFALRTVIVTLLNPKTLQVQIYSEMMDTRSNYLTTQLYH
jgi:hypothetical protein